MKPKNSSHIEYYIRLASKIEERSDSNFNIPKVKENMSDSSYDWVSTLHLTVPSISRYQAVSMSRP